MKEKADNHKLHWHPAFLEAVQEELRDYKDVLEFKEEYQLNAAPLRIDLLIIKKPRELIIDKKIARIFRSDNILEYKSPTDNLSVRDFWKVYSYANLYASITPGVDLSDLTLTFIGSRHPRKLLHYLTRIRDYTVEEISPGIYGVSGDYLPIQIIESKNLPDDENFWLKALSNDLEARRLSVILKEREKRGPEASLDAYIDIILRANEKLISEVNNMKWQETLYELIEKNGMLPKMQEIAIEQGIVQGQERIARNLLDMGMPIEDIARASELPVEKIRSLAAAG